MISARVLKKLEEYQNSPYKILSVYLGSDETQAPNLEVLHSQFHSLLHEHFTKEMREEYATDIARIEDFINNYTPSAHTLAFFSAGEQLWEVIELEFGIKPSLALETSPYVMPLHMAQTSRLPYVSLLIDREKAIAFIVNQGEIVAHTEIKTGYVQPREKGTNKDDGLRQADTEARYSEISLRRHIEQSIKEIEQFLQGRDFSFVLIGGHKPMFTKVTELLPPDLKGKVAGYFVTEMNVPLQTMLDASKQAAAER